VQVDAAVLPEPAPGRLRQDAPALGVGAAHVLGTNTSGPPPVPWSTKCMVIGIGMKFFLL
jgi:hypothetical protein